MYDDVKIELKKTKKTLDRQLYVAAKARIRTLQRIKRQQDEEKLKEFEENFMKEAASEATKTVKKG